MYNATEIVEIKSCKLLILCSVKIAPIFTVGEFFSKVIFAIADSLFSRICQGQTWFFTCMTHFWGKKETLKTIHSKLSVYTPWFKIWEGNPQYHRAGFLLKTYTRQELFLYDQNQNEKILISPDNMHLTAFF